MRTKFFKNFLIAATIFLFVFPVFVQADSEGQLQIFSVDPTYDFSGRESIQAVLKKVSQRAYFYFENEWYDGLSEEKKKTLSAVLSVISKEFDEVIHPKLTAFYGDIWSPGIDNDERITILFFKAKSDVAGYFNMNDEYEKIQSPSSNEREMIYLNAENVFYEIIKSYLAHEFTHLISFNQKDRLRGVAEEVWLNEARADFSPVYLGYDKNYNGSNGEERVKMFLESPSDSLTEWTFQKKDYGVTSVFINYLIDYYGEEILSRSMRFGEVGIPSLETALRERNVQKSFVEIFTDWAVTIFLNNCGFGEKYCYQNKNLENLRITPSLVFLPTSKKSEVSLNYSTKEWSAKWFRILGGEGELKVIFKGDTRTEFVVPYVLCKNSAFCKIEFMNLLENGEAKIFLPEFGKDYTSLTLIPLALKKTKGFGESEPSYNFSLSVSSEDKSEEKLIAELKARIADLQTQIAALQAKIAAILGTAAKGKCLFQNNLYLGMRGNDVVCLQEFLASQDRGIYPEKIVSGFFGNLTRLSVIRFQEKYKNEILAPSGLSSGNGFVGPLTRAKINQLLAR